LRLPASADGVLQVPPGGRRYEFRYTGLSFANPARVGFRHRLDGLEPEWVEAGARRSAFYTPLPPGDYRFQVTARNADGVWNEHGASFGLHVLPQFWQTWVFRAGSRVGALVTVGLTVLVIVRRRARRKLAVLERQRALERERARIARDIHDDLGSNLTHIVMLGESARSGLGNPQQAAPDLDELCHTARDLTLQLSEIVWAVAPEHDTLDSLANYAGKFAHDFLGRAGIRCRLDLPLQLPVLTLASPVRHNLFLAFKEALHNAVKHSAAKSVLVSLGLDPGAFTLLIEDDGRGFRPAAAAGTGNGLANMQRRLADIGGQCQIESEPGRGTRVRFTVPLRTA
jgi:signal transduction histidine kinase